MIIVLNKNLPFYLILNNIIIYGINLFLFFFLFINELYYISSKVLYLFKKLRIDNNFCFFRILKLYYYILFS